MQFSARAARAQVFPAMRHRPGFAAEDPLARAVLADTFKSVTAGEKIREEQMKCEERQGEKMRGEGRKESGDREREREKE